MEQEQWAVRVPRSRGEGERQRLAREGLLDRTLKPRVEGDSLLIPVASQLDGAERASFLSRGPLPELPRHELVGGIAIMPDADPAAAEELLASRPSLHTVLFPVSDVEGEYRTRRFEVLAGESTTRTTCIEYGKRFGIDLSEAYFSARLATERRHIFAQMEEGEWVLDLFSGVGPFAIVLADRAELVVAVDLNPGAVRLMEKNIRLNRAGNVLPFLADASRVRAVLPWTFDRIIMNHPTGALPFLPEAFALCRPGGSIHCYVLQSAEGEALPELRKYPVREVTERYVRSYSPGRWHAVYDIVVG
ncbi:MAG: methyltransferase domain-containing protein [Methanoregulaceae archaeon]|nr:methyltransferase domain-containing protein [Methanoregulaceae archaeon]